jgi:vancomycin resistance protein VanJ
MKTLDVTIVDRHAPRTRPRLASPLASWRRWLLLGRLVCLAAWLYAACLAALAVVVWRYGDRWWPTTLVLFGPRWVWCLPLALLACYVPRAGRRLIPPLAIGWAVWLWPLMGFCLPWRGWSDWSTPDVQLRVLSCNVAVGVLRDAALAGLIDQVQPDVVALQEAPEDAATRWFTSGKWHFRRSHKVLVGSRFPIDDMAEANWRDIGAEGSLLRCDLAIDGVSCHVFGIHLMTPRVGLEAMVRHGPRGRRSLENNTLVRGLQSAGASRLVAEASGPVIVAGDFNLPVDSAIYRDHWSRWANAFSRRGWGLGRTKWTRWFGARIDHVLANDDWRFARCWVGPDVGSDHRPVIADLCFRSPPASGSRHLEDAVPAPSGDETKARDGLGRPSYESGGEP